MSKKLITFCDANGELHDFPIEGVDYGTCSTQGSVVVKEVVCEGFSLYEGALIVVKFSYANTQYSIMMNVNGTGGKAVYFPGTTSMSTTATGHIQANGCYLFVYDGTYWRFCGSSKNKLDYGLTLSLNGSSYTFNGSSAVSKSWYAPTTAGKEGQVLKSNGSGAPTWGDANVPDDKTLELVDGKLTLKGFSEATSGQMPRVNEDGTGIEWYMPISERTVIPNVPSQSGTLTYTGSSKTPSWSNYDSSKMTLSVTPQVNAGTYTATFTPKDAYRWADGTIEPKTVNWTINKAVGSITLNKTSITLNSSTKTATFTVTRAGNGKISVSSNKTSVATVSPTSSTSTGTVTFTVSNANYTNGTATITVSVAAGTNHNATSKTITVSAEMINANLEDNEPAAIKAAAQSGQAMNLWSVGDKVPIAINGKVGAITINGTYYAVIIGFNHNSSIEGNNSIHFQFGQNSSGKDIAFVDSQYGKSGSSSAFRMNTSSLNSGGWKNSYMRTTICQAFLEALPEDWQNIIADCTKYSDNTGGGNDTSSYVTSTQDKIWLLSEYETQTTRYYANSAEHNYQNRYDYYKNGNSRVKYKHNANTTACSWWLRSVSCSNNNAFCIMATSGAASNNLSNWSNGFAPGFKVA